MPEESWPPYRVGNSDYIHALGVIASVYNLLEFRFRSLFSIYVRLPPKLAYTLFAKISNEMRLELIREAIEFSTHPEPIKDEIRHFLSGFKRCADNRNIFMHSTVIFLFGPDDVSCPALSPAYQQPQGLAFQKSPKGKGDPFQINTYQLTIEEIRAHADALKSFEIYGDRLFWHILKNHEPTRYQSFGFPEDARFALPNRDPLCQLYWQVYKGEFRNRAFISRSTGEGEFREQNFRKGGYGDKANLVDAWGVPR
jgi:hypothetical protein